ncbi:MAG: FAD-dependent oxidoreductase [Gammaproteobacteria bacterium]|jgi:NADPH-dependent 2,4-dienoyl-CoA reductase/sulfur reductase-like enzyme|nr:FAD-dependent oxidoreductase [Gammaproteobacteria bacterium]
MQSAYQMVVIGAGPAGMAAAQTAARQGVEVAVIDEQPHPGGQIYRNVNASPLADIDLLGKDYVFGRQLVQGFEYAHLDYFANSGVWFLDRAGELGIVQDGVHRRVSAQRIVIACGAQERAMPFPGWDKAGVMTAGAAQILMKSAAMVPSEAPVLAGNGPLLLLLAWQYLRAGVRLRAIVDTAQSANRWPALRYFPQAIAASDYLFKGLKLVSAIRRARVPWFREASDLRALGEERLSALHFTCRGKPQHIDTTLLLLHQGVIPALQIAAAAGCETRWNSLQQCWQPQVDDWGQSSVDSVFVAGDAAGIGGARAAWLGGQLAGLQLAHQLGLIDAVKRDKLAQPIRKARARHLAIRPFLDTWYRVAESSLVPGDETLACRCEEVSVGEIRTLAAMGCTGPNQAKAFTRCGMGPCQGRFCGSTVEQVFASETAASPQQIGRFNTRPPLKPVTLGQIAGIAHNEQR